MKYLKNSLVLIFCVFCCTSCSDRLKAVANPYAHPVEDYPEVIDLPAEGGSVTLSFESNFYVWSHLSFWESSGFQLDKKEHKYSDYHRRFDFTISAGENTSHTELTDTLCIEFNFPTFLLPINASKIIEEYIIYQNPIQL